nr:MAG TPA: hypothetical protein [Caudoviricetes sp.]
MQISEVERRFVKMIYVHNEQTIIALQWGLNKFLSENKNDILKIDRRGLPILVEMKNGDIVLFMTFIAFHKWEIGRRDYKII